MYDQQETFSGSGVGEVLTSALQSAAQAYQANLNAQYGVFTTPTGQIINTQTNFNLIAIAILVIGAVVIIKLV